MSEEGETMAMETEMGTQELTVVQRELPALVPTAVAKARLLEIRQFVKEELREGIDQDYAVIPGTGKKPSLLQPGAEKLIEKLGLAPTFPQTSVHWAYENHEAGEYMVDVLCQLLDIYREVRAECWGSAGRSAQEEVEASNAKAREYHRPERTLSFRDKGLARNTAIKLAQKSALVGATLKAARLAVEFTQDVEDFNRPGMPNGNPPTKPTTERPDSDHVCLIHKVAFKRYSKPDGEAWYSHKLADKTWCNEAKAKPTPTPPQTPAQPQGEAPAPTAGEPPVEPGQAALDEAFGTAKPHDTDAPESGTKLAETNGRTLDEDAFKSLSLQQMRQEILNFQKADRDRFGRIKVSLGLTSKVMSELTSDDCFRMAQALTAKD